jgi:hypothetical protein
MLTYVIEGEMHTNHSEVLAWAKELTSHIKSLNASNPPRLMVERFGHRNKLYFVQNFATLKELEDFQATMATDPKYKQLISQRKWTHPSVKDRVLTLLD